MPTVLGVIGSPRPLGNCEIVVKEVAAGLGPGHDLRLLRLSDCHLQPCRACYRCLFGERRCVIDDDFDLVLAAIAGADALIVAAPAYFLGAAAVLKRVSDRGLAFYAHLERLWRTPAVGVAVAGIPGKEGRTLLDVDAFLTGLYAERRMTRVVYGALPGEVFLNPENRRVAGELAAALQGPPPRRSARSRHCPLCGGDTFRFLEDGRVRCMLCSNPGRLVPGPDGPEVETVKEAPGMFFSRDEARHHYEWLVGMKGRFLEQRRALKNVTGAYRGRGSWVRPVRTGPSGADPEGSPGGAGDGRGPGD